MHEFLLIYFRYRFIYDKCFFNVEFKKGIRAKHVATQRNLFYQKTSYVISKLKSLLTYVLYSIVMLRTVYTLLLSLI